MAKDLPPATIELIAQRFRAMGEPMRLRILMALREGERSVTELVEQQETSQANISKHLQVLTACGLLTRRKQGLNVLYAIADPGIFSMCDSVCGSIKKHLDTQAKLLG
ncbi:MAG: winged helix-turn-helix transcriptional regulator [Opitutaceae bacterium]|nr:winged helix-turn-helix transcriptional regulator [Opitutaceae bacterium]